MSSTFWEGLIQPAALMLSWASPIESKFYTVDFTHLTFESFQVFAGRPPATPPGQFLYQFDPPAETGAIYRIRAWRNEAFCFRNRPHDLVIKSTMSDSSI